MKISMVNHGTCLSFYSYKIGLLFLLAVCHVASHKKIILRDYSGSFTSPNYASDFPYPLNTTIDWVIIAPARYRSEVTIRSFDLWRCYAPDDNPDCSLYDSVKIFITPTGVLLGHFCNGHVPTLKPFYAIQGNLIVRFKSLSTREACRGKGFEATYRMYQVVATQKPEKPPVLTEYVRPAATTRNFGTEIHNPTIITIIAFSVAAVIIFPLVVYCCLKCMSKNNGRQNVRRGGALESADISSNRPNVSAGMSTVPPPVYEPRGNTSIEIHSSYWRPEVRPSSTGPPPSYRDSCELVVACPPSRGSHASMESRTSQELPPTYEEATSTPLLREEENERRSVARHSRDTSASEQTSDGTNRVASREQTRRGEEIESSIADIRNQNNLYSRDTGASEHTPDVTNRVASREQTHNGGEIEPSTAEIRDQNTLDQNTVNVTSHSTPTHEQARPGGREMGRPSIDSPRRTPSRDEVFV